MVQENHAKEHKSYSQFKETSTKDKPGVNCVDEGSTSDEETEVCITEWVDTPKNKPLTSRFSGPVWVTRMRLSLPLTYLNATNCSTFYCRIT
jgi:hypothetical protein